MNNIVEKIKNYFSSNFGKLAGMIICFSFIITLMLSITEKNRIDISIIRSFLSSVITGCILFIISFILKKYLGDIIEESSFSNDSNTDYNTVDNNIIDGNIVDNNTLDNDKIDDTMTDNSDINADIVKPNIDKNTKSNYDSSNDIGDIILGKSNASMPKIDYSSNSSTFSSKKANENEILKEVHEDPEKVAKAIRTMISKDKDE